MCLPVLTTSNAHHIGTAEALNSVRAWFGSMYEGVPEVADESPGKRARAAYVSQMASHSTWRSRVDAPEVEVASPSTATG